jgi:hypothetical protein
VAALEHSTQEWEHSGIFRQGHVGRLILFGSPGLPTQWGTYDSLPFSWLFWGLVRDGEIGYHPCGAHLLLATYSMGNLRKEFCTAEE